MTERQIKIIEAAEIEFALRGFEGASVRRITSRAGVNIAAINYHFGSKEDLFKEMVRYRIGPINEQRLEALDAALARSGGEPLPVTEIVEIIVKPLFSNLMGQDGGKLHFMQAMGRGLTEEKAFMAKVQEEIFSEVVIRFNEAIRGALDIKNLQQLFYSAHFVTCCITGAMMQHGKLGSTSGGKVDLHDTDGLTDRLVAFISGGLVALDHYENAD